jgi:hypothetical protein
LRFQFAILVLIGLLPTAGLVSYDQYSHQRWTIERTADLTRRTAESIVATQSRVIDSGRVLLGLLGRLPVATRPQDPACGALLAGILADQPRYAGLGIHDRHGNLLCSAPPARAPVNSADRSWFRRAVETGAFAIGD